MPMEPYPRSIKKRRITGLTETSTSSNCFTCSTIETLGTPGTVKPYIDITESAKKDAIKKMEEAFKKKYSGIKADIRRIIIGEYLDFSPNIQ